MCAKLERNDFMSGPKFKIFLLLVSLPSEHYPLVVALETRDDLEMSCVKGRLVDECKRLAENEQHNKQLMLVNGRRRVKTLEWR